MIIDSPVYAPQSSLPTSGVEGQTCFITGVGPYCYISGQWVLEIGGEGGGSGPSSTDGLPEGQTNKYFLPARVLAAPLTGYVVGSDAAIAATDTVSQGFGKVQGQINAVSDAVELKLDADANAVSATKLSTARTINGVAFDGTENITLPLGDSTKEPIIAGGTNSQYWRGDKSWQTLNKAAVGLSDVDNTADAAKPVSTAQQAALDLKLGKTEAAASATKLATARTINGVAFDGTANITLAADSSKEPAIAIGTTAQYFRGDKTFVDFATTVNASLLTGVVLTNRAAITAADNHLTAIGKLQAQQTNLVKVAAVASTAIDCSLGSYFTKTITTVTTFTVTNVPATGTCASIMLELTNGGSQTVNWFSGVTWASGIAPILTASGVDVLGFYTLNGGTTWRGFLMAKDIK